RDRHADGRHDVSGAHRLHGCAHSARPPRQDRRGGGADLLARERGDVVRDRRVLRHLGRQGGLLMAKRVTVGNYIGGEWRDPRSGETYEKRTRRPAGEPTGASPAPDGRAVDAAGGAAQGAFAGWSRLSAPQRGNHLLKVADAVDGRGEQTASEMTREMGKP